MLFDNIVLFVFFWQLSNFGFHGPGATPPPPRWPASQPNLLALAQAAHQGSSKRCMLVHRPLLLLCSPTPGLFNPETLLVVGVWTLPHQAFLHFRGRRICVSEFSWQTAMVGGGLSLPTMHSLAAPPSREGG